MIATLSIFVSRAAVIAMAVIAMIGLTAQTNASEILPVSQAFEVYAEHLPDNRIRLDFTIAPGTHLYRDKIAVTSNGKPVAVTTPSGTIEDDPSFGKTEVFYGQTQATFTAPSSRTVEVSYQGCQDHGICYPPIHRTLNLSTLAFSGSSATKMGSPGAGWALGDSPAAAPSTPEAAATTAKTASTPAETATSPEGKIISAGWLVLIVSFAGFGLLLAFTPCVLPMYPILGGMLARQGERLSAGRGFAVSLTYVIAMATAFGVLGVAAALGGENLQVALQSPAAIGVMAAIFILLAASMFGLFDIAVPSAIADRLFRRMPGRQGSLTSAMVLGFSSALIVGPCVTPPLAAALVYVAQTGDVARGATALFALGFGQGLPLILFGTFGSGLLPKTGGWMVATKGIFGFIFLGAAVWILSRVIEPRITMLLWAVLLVTAGVFAGAFDMLRTEAGKAVRLGKAAGLLSVIAGAIMLTGAATGGSDPLQPLAGLVGSPSATATSSPELSFDKVASESALLGALASARDQGKPAMVYFTADWCVSCRTIDRHVLPAGNVRQALAGYSRIEVDLTKLDNDKRALMKKLSVVGPPTMLFFPPANEAHPAKRLVGELSASELANTAADLSTASN